jgi:hypothetical protein
LLDAELHEQAKLLRLDAVPLAKHRDASLANLDFGAADVERRCRTGGGAGARQVDLRLSAGEQRIGELRRAIAARTLRYCPVTAFRRVASAFVTSLSAASRFARWAFGAMRLAPLYCTVTLSDPSDEITSEVEPNACPPKNCGRPSRYEFENVVETSGMSTPYDVRSAAPAR